MMKTFLEHVAQDILSKYSDLSDIAVVFPNKRAALFMDIALASLSEKPVWSPAYITISELFRQQSNLQVADPIKLIAELHRSYTTVTGKTETLDQFYGWGQLLLADFDDIDKNEADASHVFRNLRDLHEYDDISYLSDEQRAVLKRFFSNFRDDDSTLQRRFMELWSRLYDIYEDFRKRLCNQGLAYEGMLYREVAAQAELNLPSERYLFVGFNMIQKVEQHLFSRLKTEGKAAFYWDYDRYYLDNEAGVYIRRYLTMFPNELPGNRADIYSQFADRRKDIAFVSAPTENLQARYITEWLRQKNRIVDGRRTAIVMCNEGLLQTVVHCIPGEVESINVTTGYPLHQTSVASLVSLLILLQYNGYAQRQDAFRLHYINMVLRHPYARFVSEQAPVVLKELNEAKSFYTKRSRLLIDEGMSLLFAPLENVESAPTEQDFNLLLLNWLRNIVKLIAKNAHAATAGAAQTPDAQLRDESLFRMYTLLNRLTDLVGSEEIIVDKTTLQRFINQLVRSTTIPFHGEPAEGIQVMGVLETRNLDFDHVLILSCNEGNMPKGVDDASFIPHAVRHAYELTTIDNKVAIYSYYFHRLIQRAADVTVLYNSTTDERSTGEMSRFMLQLLVELGQPVSRLSLQAGQTPARKTVEGVEKDETVEERLNAVTLLSPTAINRYMRCPLQFYYHYIAGIKESDDNDEDDIDNRIFGNIFHRAAELMYETLLPKDLIEARDIQKVLGQKDKLHAVVAQAFSEVLFNLPEGTVSHPALNGMQLINQEVIETYLRQLLRIDLRMVPFRVIGHEQAFYQEIELDNGRRLSIGGRIDRLDESGIGTPQHQLRVVDYKTGNRTQKGVKSIAEIFDPKNIRSKHTDYQLQAILYALIVGQDKAYANRLPVSPALLFIQHAGSDDYSPVLTIDGKPVTDANLQCGSDFTAMLKEKLQEIFDPATPFHPTDDVQICETCPYRELCGRA